MWNEPNLPGFFTGTPTQLVTLAAEAWKIIKEVDPASLVVSPSITGSRGVAWLDRYLEAGGGKYADIIGYHFYVNPAEPEQMLPMMESVKTVLARHGMSAKPLWNTETGWAIAGFQKPVSPASGKGFNSIVLSPSQASAYLLRTYVLSWAAGVARLYWYAWDSAMMGLVEADGKTPKATALAYGVVQDWLVGARMLSCAKDPDGTWIAELARPEKGRAWIVWNPGRTSNFVPPKGWNIRATRDLSGAMLSIRAGQAVVVDSMPVLLEAGEE